MLEPKLIRECLLLIMWDQEEGEQNNYLDRDVFNIEELYVLEDDAIIRSSLERIPLLLISASATLIGCFFWLQMLNY